MSNSEQYKLGDFGEAKTAVDVQRENTLRGTVAYMSPALQRAFKEGIKTLIHNPYRSDVYSLGMTLLSMATLTHFDSQPHAEAQELISSLPYSDDLKKVIQCMLHPDEENRPDFLKLKGIISDMQHSISSYENQLKELVDKIVYQIRISTEANAQISRFLEEAWHCAFLNMLNAPILHYGEVPQLYVKKVDLYETFNNLSLYSVRNQLSSYRFDYIPISKFVTNPRIIAPKALTIVRKNSENQETGTERIEGYTGILPMYGKSNTLLFIIRKTYEKVTAAEPPTKNLSAMIKLDPNKVYIVTEGQFYRMGQIVIEVQSMNETRISLCSITLSNERSSICLSGLEVTVGTSNSNTYQLNTVGVSGNHAVIRRQNGNWTIQDLRSTNGTWLFLHTVNSMSRESDEMQIEEGQQISCQREFFSYHIEP